MKTMVYRKIGAYYSSFAIILLNLLIGIVGFNALLYGAYWIEDKHRGSDASGTSPESIAQLKYSDAVLSRIYPGLDRKTIDGILTESWSRPQIFSPYTLSKERASKGTYVNESEAGFRDSKNQGPWPPSPGAFNVFVFGGSTTFGYGLPDWQTVPSFLQEALGSRMKLQVSVYNFGAGAYQSTQERIQFEELLAQGRRPNLVVFIDGMNEFAFPVPSAAAELERLTLAGHETKAPRGNEIFANWPMARLAAAARSKFIRAAPNAGTAADTGQAGSQQLGPASIQDLIDSAGRRYLANERLIEAVAREFGGRAIFVWAPMPFYKYDKTYHLFLKNDTPLGVNRYAKQGYEHMDRLLETQDMGRDFLWCADIQENLKEPLYVDVTHYTAAMSERLAQYIAKLSAERGLLAGLESLPAENR